MQTFAKSAASGKKIPCASHIEGVHEHLQQGDSPGGRVKFLPDSQRCDGAYVSSMGCGRPSILKLGLAMWHWPALLVCKSLVYTDQSQQISGYRPRVETRCSIIGFGIDLEISAIAGYSSYEENPMCSFGRMSPAFHRLGSPKLAQASSVRRLAKQHC